MSKVFGNITGSGKIVTEGFFAGVWLAWFGKQGG
jgi:hypothetical protein